jgi:hypothetical protein
VLIRLKTSSGLSALGGIPKDEWIVCPPTFSAAIAVGATTAQRSNFDRTKRIIVDFPVPA